MESPTVTDLYKKVRNRRLDLGVLVAANGVTGEPVQRRAAIDIIRGASDRDNIKLLVVTRAETEAFRSIANIVALMREKFASLIMGLPTV